jgi:hypothetical protein
MERGGLHGLRKEAALKFVGPAEVEGAGGGVVCLGAIKERGSEIEHVGPALRRNLVEVANSEPEDEPSGFALFVGESHACGREILRARAMSFRTRGKQL